MNNVKVAVWGLGAMGSGIARALLKKQGVDVVGACERSKERCGRSLYEVLGVSRGDRADVTVTADINEAVRRGECDICVVATDSFVERVFPKLETLLKLGVNVITIAEEMSYPKAQYPEYAKRLDRLAKENNVSVMGTGVNPGLVMDLLAICLSGCMTEVDSVFCERINSLSPFGEAVMQEQGIGISLDEFDKGVGDGSLAGHVGFAESVGMISDALGLGVDGFRQQMSPIVTDFDRRSPHGFAAAGHVAGVDMKGQGTRGGKVVVDMSHPQQIEPESAGVETGDYIVLRGDNNVSMQIKPEINGGAGTIAMCVNCIPHVINADSGLLSMIDIPVPHAILDDFRNHIKPDKKLV